MSMHPERLKDKSAAEVLAHVLARYRDMVMHPASFPSMGMQFIEMQDILEEATEAMKDRPAEVTQAVPKAAPKAEVVGNGIAVGMLREIVEVHQRATNNLRVYASSLYLRGIADVLDGVSRSIITTIARLQENNEPETTEVKPERCPTCGEPVASIFDHVDRNDIDPATGYCKENG